MVEILVAVAVVAIVGTLGFLTFGNRDAAMLRGEAADIALLLQQGRLMAAEAGRPVIVAFDPDDNVFAAGPRSHEFGRGVSADVTPARIRLAPSGESEGMRIVLTRGSARAAVELDWLTGRVEIAR